MQQADAGEWATCTSWHHLRRGLTVKPFGQRAEVLEFLYLQTPKASHSPLVKQVTILRISVDPGN
jgi:hypothetical protein